MAVERTLTELGGPREGVDAETTKELFAALRDELPKCGRHRDASHINCVECMYLSSKVYAPLEEIERKLADALGALETAERRLRHSEWHRTANRRRMRKLGKYQGVLEAKIIRQREALREFARPTKRRDAHARAADLHHSLRSEP